jgi:hypothetical protein
MNKTLTAVLLPFFAVAGGTIGLIWWDRGAPPGFNPTAHPTAIDGVTREHRGVQLTGTAHYTVRLNQTMEDGEVVWIFPLMAAGDTLGREIKVLVRTPRQPEHMVTFEDLIVDGIASPPGRLISPEVIDSFQDGGYDFADGFVLITPFKIAG